MLDSYAATDRGMRELQEVTAAFLTDRFDNGDYVATTDDIADLEQATMAFLADRTDGECFCLEEIGQGLLLPGEQFLLPSSLAVDRARFQQNNARDVIDIIDEYLHAQMTLEDMPSTPLLDATNTVSTDAPEMVYTSFGDTLGPQLLPGTPLSESQEMPPTFSEPVYSALEYVLSFPEEHGQLLGVDDIDVEGISNSIDEMASTTTADLSDVAFDAPDALSHTQASYATSFFDLTTGTIVPYTSFNGLLQMQFQDGCVQELNGSSDGSDSAGSEQINERVLLDAYDDSNEAKLGDRNWPVNASITELNDHQLRIDTNLATIQEEEEPSSAVSDLSLDFSNHRGVLKSLTLRRADFLDEDGESSPIPRTTIIALGGEETIGIAEVSLHNECNTVCFADMFVNDIWNSEGTELSHNEGNVRYFADVFTDGIWNSELDLELAQAIPIVWCC